MSMCGRVGDCARAHILARPLQSCCRDMNSFLLRSWSRDPLSTTLPGASMFIQDADGTPTMGKTLWGPSTQSHPRTASLPHAWKQKSLHSHIKPRAVPLKPAPPYSPASSLKLPLVAVSSKLPPTSQHGPYQGCHLKAGDEPSEGCH